MSQYGQDRPRTDVDPLAVTGVYVAVALLLVQGVLSVLEGVAAIAGDHVYVVIHTYTYKFDLTAWGWTQLVLGVVMSGTGLGLLRNMAWARATGIALASLNVITNFMFLPYQPLWSITLIGISVFLIWSLCTATADDLR